MTVDRRKDAAATREDILCAARRAFTERGYDGAGVREIAAAAGIHPSLVNRYFGTKERLFAEAVPATFGVQPLLSGERAGFGRALATYLLAKEPREFDATLAMVRSAGNPEAARLLRDGLDERFVGPLAAWLGGPDAEARAGLVLSLLAGVAIVRDVLGVGALREDAEAVERRLGEALEGFVGPQGQG